VILSTGVLILFCSVAVDLLVSWGYCTGAWVVHIDIFWLWAVVLFNLCFFLPVLFNLLVLFDLDVFIIITMS